MARRIIEARRPAPASRDTADSPATGHAREHGRPNLAGPAVDDAADLRRRLQVLEASLVLVENRLRQITAASLDMICQLGPDGVLTLVSPASATVLGYAPEEMVGTHFRDYFDPGPPGSAAAMFERAALGERIELLELNARHRDGHAVPLEVCAEPLVLEGRVIGVQAIVRDVTRRKATEDGLRCYNAHLERLIQSHDSEMVSLSESLATKLDRSRHKERVLREREELLRAAFEQAAVGLALVSPDGRFLRVNEALADLLGLGRDEVLRRRWHDLTHPADLDRERGLWEKLCSGGETSFVAESRLRRGDGSFVVARVMVSPLRTKDATPSHLVIVAEPARERRPARR